MNQEINRVAEHQWHAVEDDTTVGRGYAAHRPDGRLFLSVDTWQDRVFDRLAAAMLDDLTGPLYVVVDETDHESRSSWERAGFATRRREWEYHVPTDPAVTGLGSVLPPPGVRIVPVGHAEPEPLRELDHAIRTEVEAAVGWREMPAEVLLRAHLDPAGYAVAATQERYVGLVRLARGRVPRIGLVAVLTGERRRGIARALLAHVLGSLHGVGSATAWAEVNESNPAAVALFDGVGGGRRVSSSLELVKV